MVIAIAMAIAMVVVMVTAMAMAIANRRRMQILRQGTNQRHLNLLRKVSLLNEGVRQ